MARKKSPVQPRPVNLSQQQMRAAIPRLEKRISEIKAMDIDSVEQSNDPQITSLEKKVDDT